MNCSSTSMPVKLSEPSRDSYSVKQVFFRIDLNDFRRSMIFTATRSPIALYKWLKSAFWTFSRPNDLLARFGR